MDSSLLEPTASAYARLNAEQPAASTFGRADPSGFTAGPLLIIAGAGTGKTNSLAHRVAHLLLEGVAPERILLLTFTRRAAQEMLRRAERIAAETLRARAPHAELTDPTRGLWSATCHALGNRLSREYAHAVGLHPAFSRRGRARPARALAR